MEIDNYKVTIEWSKGVYMLPFRNLTDKAVEKEKEEFKEIALKKFKKKHRGAKIKKITFNKIKPEDHL